VILLIDIGNTRIKWARFERGALQPQSAAVHAA
jgi:pantothenate kinase type III